MDCSIRSSAENGRVSSSVVLRTLWYRRRSGLADNGCAWLACIVLSETKDSNPAAPAHDGPPQHGCAGGRYCYTFLANSSDEICSSRVFTRPVSWNQPVTWRSRETEHQTRPEFPNFRGADNRRSHPGIPH